MVVLTEKDLGYAPPPPYFAIEQEDKSSRGNLSSLRSSYSTSTVHLLSSSSMRESSSRSPRTAPNLPSHILLLIVYSTLPVPGEYRLDRATGIRRRESAEEMAIRTTRTLYWMAFCLRAVSRGFYLASMHILRSTFLPYYMQRVHEPYSSDPFPHTSDSPQQHENPPSLSFGGVNSHSGSSVVTSTQCESEVLDLYILHQLHEDVFADDTSLHLLRPETLRDLFDFMQPRARLTDLIRAYGAGAGLIAFSEEELDAPDEGNIEDNEEEDAYPSNASTSTLTSLEKKPPGLNLKSKLSRSTSALTLINPPPSPATAPSPPASQLKFQTYSPSPTPFSSRQPILSRRRQKILCTALRVSFSFRRVGLVYTPPSLSGAASGSGPRTIVDVPRDREEPLERCASRLVAGLKAWMDSSANY